MRYHDLNVSNIRDEIKRLSQRYADRMEEYPDIIATNVIKKVKTTRRLKRKLKSQNNTPIKKKITSRLVYLIVL